jgi:cysteine desulfurase NifS/selenium donor protein
MKPIYLDYNATTPIAPSVAEAMIPYLREEFGNPSSSHLYGFRTKRAVEKARFQVASLLGCKPEEIVFTSGGTESNNYAIRGYAFKNRSKGRHIITSQIEHPAVLEVCGYLERYGFEVSYLPVDEHGRVHVSEIERALRPDTILVTIMLANNEVGTLQPIAEISQILKSRGICFHTDAAQAIGKIPVRVDELGVDMLSVAGHKLYAPKGIGALYVRTGADIEKLMLGASHESDRRAGTENVLEIVGLGAACELAASGLEDFASNMSRCRNRFQSLLERRYPDAKINGHLTDRLPNTLSVSFPGIEANIIISEAVGIAVSAGAACHSGSVTMSHVLKAMGIPESIAVGTIRITTGRDTTDDEIDAAFEQLSNVVDRLGGINTDWSPMAESHHETTPVSQVADMSALTDWESTSTERITDKAGASVQGSVIDDEIRLTRFTHGLGCACKLRPQLLEAVMNKLPRPIDSRILVGTETSDDAAVFLIDDKTAIVQTVDFFTPIVDDPYEFGQIAAANSLSDIYAMGAKPLFALSIVGFPSNRLPQTALEEILRGAADKAAEAGIGIIGGHTVDDTEPKYGLAVTGIVDPKQVWRNKGARPGDRLILTKPIGTGILATAAKQGLLDDSVRKALFETMAFLNRTAADVLSRYDVHACTDVTGFGLAGHLWEMTSSSGVSAELHAAEIPILAGARETALGGTVPSGTVSNMEHVENKVRWSKSVDRVTRVLICDAQTSGGLLVAVSANVAEKIVRELHQVGITDASVIGDITGEGDGMITVS